MTDQRSFKPVTTSFEETWPKYFGAGFVRLAIKFADWRVRARARRGRSSDKTAEWSPLEQAQSVRLCEDE
jgi:hypothetical protein